MSVAMGQDVADEAAPASPITKNYHWSFGLQGGYVRNTLVTDLSYLDGFTYAKYSPGNTYGLRIGYSPARWLTFRLDAVMIQKNSDLGHVYQYYSTRYTMSTHTTNQYVNVPLVLMFNVGKNVQLHGFGGAYAGYWLSCHRTGESYSMPFSIYGDTECNKYDEEYTFSEVRDNRYDVGFTWGAGISTVISHRFEVGAEVRWYYGIFDTQKEYMANVPPRYNTTFVIQGGVSYRL